MDEASSKLKVRVGDGASWIGGGDEAVNDVLGPFQVPQNRTSIITMARWKVGGRELNASCTST